MEINQEKLSKMQPIFQMCEEGMTYKEIGKMMNMHPQTVSRYYKVAKRINDHALMQIGKPRF